MIGLGDSDLTFGIGIGVSVHVIYVLLGGQHCIALHCTALHCTKENLHGARGLVWTVQRDSAILVYDFYAVTLAGVGIATIITTCRNRVGVPGR